MPDKGLDRVFVFKLDPKQGTLVLNDPPSVATRSGAGPRHVAFHPTAGFAYVVNELDSTVTAYNYDRVNGSLEPKQILTTLPATFTGENRAAGIGITPSGKFLYASNRGFNQISIFAIDQATGMLNAVGWESTRGKTPRFFTLDPSGKFLYAANETVKSHLEQQSKDGSVKVEVIEFPVEDKRALREVFEKYDIRGVFNLAKRRASSLVDEDYVMRRNAVDFGVPLFMEPRVSFLLSPFFLCEMRFWLTS